MGGEWAYSSSYSPITRIRTGQETTELTWRDTAESWEALIKLRSELQSERGQAVLECIVNDASVLRGLGMAHQLRDIAGKPPDVLLIAINEGPGSLSEAEMRAVASYVLERASERWR